MCRSDQDRSDIEWTPPRFALYSVPDASPILRRVSGTGRHKDTEPLRRQKEARHIVPPRYDVHAADYYTMVKCIYIHSFIHTCMNVCMYVSMHVCVCVCVHMHMLHEYTVNC